MNAQISGTAKAKDTKFGMWITVYHKIIKLVSNLRWHIQRTKKSLVKSFHAFFMRSTLVNTIWFRTHIALCYMNLFSKFHTNRSTDIEVINKTFDIVSRSTVCAFLGLVHIIYACVRVRKQ